MERESVESSSQKPHAATWAEVDVPGSPKLSRLFAALEVQCPDDALSFFLPEVFDTKYDSNDTDHFYHWNTQSSAAFEDTGKIDNETYDHLFLQDCSGLVSLDNPVRQAETPVKFLGQDIFFPTGDVLSPRPLGEVYCFPSYSTGTGQPAFTPNRFCRFQAKESEYRNYLVKLKRLLPENHPAIIATMNGLADSFYQQGKPHLAEKWHKRRVLALQKTQGRKSLQTLSAWISLVNAITSQSRCEEARELHRRVHSTIVDMLPTEHDLVLRSMWTMSRISEYMGNFENAETLRRQQVQIRLTHLGPKDPGTVSALCHLANTIASLGKYSESEKLLRIVLQLSYDTVGTTYGDPHVAHVMRSLTYILRAQENYKESLNIGIASVERSKASLGDDHPETLRCSYHLTITMRDLGFHRECGELLRVIAKQQSGVLGENHADTLVTVYEVGQTLLMVGELEKATKWLEKAFWGRMGIYGPLSQWTRYICQDLGECYVKQGRGSDALRLYEEMAENIRSLDGAGHPALDEVLAWKNSLRTSNSESWIENFPELF